MPLVGFGIWKVPRERCADAVYDAIKMGYRHIDGAYDYQNSAEAGQGVARAIKDGLVKREDLFIVSKLWNNYHRREHAIEMAKREVATWGLDYLDLYLIHFPISLQYIPEETLKWPCFWTDAERTKCTPLDPVPIAETYGALETLVKTPTNPGGILRSIGVANFHTQLLYDLLASAKIHPAVVQVEHHPYLVQPNLIAMAQENNIAVTAYSSFGPQSFLELGNKRAVKIPSLLEHPVVTKVAAAHAKTPAQVLLRWATQRGIIVIPKSNNSERLKQNLESTNFDMTKEELAEISALDMNLRFNDPADFDPPIRIFC